MAQNIPLYQGEDFSQPLSYFTDVAETIPLVFTNPVMDIRASDGTLLAVFDTTGLQKGLMTITGPGAMTLTMPYAATAALPAATYAVDIFADVGGSRQAITKRGLLSVKVSPRITRDDGP